MYLIDANGQRGELSGIYANSSLQEKLQNAVPEAAKAWELDLSRLIYVFMEEPEQHYFLRSFKENHWVRLSKDQPFNPETENLIPALRAISDKVNNNHTNGNSRFVPLRARRMTSEPLAHKSLYGWYYIAIPQEIRIDANTKIQVIFT